MLSVVSAGVAPGLALLSYFYLKDRYQSKPFGTVFKSFIFGALLVFPIMFIQYAFMEEDIIRTNWQEAFLLAGLLEEFVKWFVFVYTVYFHIRFQAHYEGIVYGVAISLGFASVENVLYLLEHGIHFAVGRAVLPVSSHALFGVIMGYYLGKAKVSVKHHKQNIFLSLLIPVLLHGTYDYILMTISEHWFYIMLPFMLLLWWYGLRKVKLASRMELTEIHPLTPSSQKSG